MATDAGLAIRGRDGVVRRMDTVGDQRLRAVTGLARDGEGGVWITSGSSFPGAFRWFGGAWKHFGEAEGRSAPLVHAAAGDSQGRVWFLGLSPDYGVNEPGVFVRERGRVEPWGPGQGLPSQRVYSFVEGGGGALFENALVGMGRINLADGSILAADERLAHIFGYPDAGVLASEFRVEKHFQREDSLDRFLLRFGTENSDGPVESEIRRTGGQGAWIRFLAYMNREEGYLEGAVEDITGEREAEVERERLGAQLQQAQKMEAVGQLTGGVAHDFNNLLTVIQGNLELLLVEEGEDPEETRLLATEALEAARRGSTLTQRLLAFARKQPLRPKVLDVNEVLDGIDTLLRRAIGEDVEIVISQSPRLWPAEVDQHQLENAVLNLAITARDAMVRGGRLGIGTRRACFSSEDAAGIPELQAGDCVEISVSDTGSGMTREVAARALDPFFTTKGPGRGSGLGLSMVFGFVKQSGGHLRLSSEPGEGTTVKIYLPRAAAERVADQETWSHEAGSVGRSEQILVVEDEESVRMLVRRQLGRLGDRPVMASDASEALAELDRSRGVALLLTDVVLPGGMTGVDLAREAVARREELKVLFMSGYAQDEIVHHGRLDPGVSLPEKPFDLHALAREIQRCLAE